MSKPLNPNQSVANLKPFTEALPEVTKLTAVAETGANLTGKYFTLVDGDGNAFYVYFTRDSVGADPAPGGTGIVVALAGDETAAQVAAAMVAAIAANAAFLAVADGAVVQISNAVSGAATDLADGDSGLVIAVEKQGQAETYSPGMNPATISNNPSAF